MKKMICNALKALKDIPVSGCNTDFKGNEDNIIFDPVSGCVYQNDVYIGQGVLGDGCVKVTMKTEEDG